jgi:hypothetical protein
MPKIRVLAALAATALSGACADNPVDIDPPAFIVNGTPTGNAYASVGALLFDYNADGIIDGDDQWCTGSLIAPTVFLTAAHCVYPDSYTPAGSQFYVSIAPDLYASSMTPIEAVSYAWDPAFGRGQANLHDLAVVILPAGSTIGLTPLDLPPAGALDQLAAHGGLRQTLFVNVGYGTSSTRVGVPGFPYDGLRSMSKSKFMGLQPTWLGLLMNTSATGEGGDCYGDSGGPKFIDGDATTIYATVFTGDYPCRATTWDWRLDTPEARGFLGNYVTLP